MLLRLRLRLGLSRGRLPWLAVLGLLCCHWVLANTSILCLLHCLHRLCIHGTRLVRIWLLLLLRLWLALLLVLLRLLLGSLHLSLLRLLSLLVLLRLLRLLRLLSLLRLLLLLLQSILLGHDGLCLMLIRINPASLLP